MKPKIILFKFTQAFSKSFKLTKHNSVNWVYQDVVVTNSLHQFFNTSPSNAFDEVYRNMDIFFDYSLGIAGSKNLPSNIINWLNANFKNEEEITERLYLLFYNIESALNEAVNYTNKQENEYLEHKAFLLKSIKQVYLRFEKETSALSEWNSLSTHYNDSLNHITKIIRIIREGLFNRLYEIASYPFEEIKLVQHHTFFSFILDNMYKLYENHQLPDNPNASLTKNINFESPNFQFLVDYLFRQVDRIIFYDIQIIIRRGLNKNSSPFNDALLRLLHAAKFLEKYSEKANFPNILLFVNRCFKVKDENGIYLFQIGIQNERQDWQKLLDSMCALLKFIFEPSPVAVSDMFILGKNASYRNHFLRQFFNTKYDKQKTLSLSMIDHYNAFSSINNPYEPIRYTAIHGYCKSSKNIMPAIIQDIFSPFEVHNGFA